MSERRLSNRARYNALAGAYEVLLRLASLGQVDRLYRAIADALDPLPGGTLVEFGCGPATLTPYLVPKVGSAATIIGIDIAEKMIGRARRKAERLGWHNVRFERGDALDYAPTSPLDAVVFCLSLSTMSDCDRCLERASSMLRPGGQLLILDSIPERSRPFANLLIQLKAPLVGARPTARPLEFASARLEGARVRRLFGGVYSLLSARKPRTTLRGAW